MITALTSGLILGLTAGVAPGPLLALVVSQTLNYGTKEGIKVALAPLVSDLPIVLLAFGIVLYLKSMTWLPGLLSLAGAFYICRLAWESFTIKAADHMPVLAQAHSLKRGILVNLLNPHPYLFWLTVGTSLLLKAWSATPWASILWVAGFYFMLVGSKISLAILAGRTRTFLSSRGYLMINRILALLLFFFSAILIKDGVILLGWVRG